MELPDQRTIANKAMLLLGSGRRIATLDDRDSDDAADLLALWDIARRSAITLHPWNFALKRIDVTRDPQVSARRPIYRYAKPADCLRWLPWSRDHELYVDLIEEGDWLLADDEGPIVLRYLRDVPEVARWAPLFVDVMAYTLAAEYCQGKTQLLGLRDRLTNERAELLRDAKRVDGAQSGNQRRGALVARTSRWAGARFTRNGTRGAY